MTSDRLRMKPLLFDLSYQDALNGGGFMSLGAIDSEKCGKPPEWRSNANKKVLNC